MLLTETIKNSTSAITKRRAAQESKQNAENYGKAINQLDQTTLVIRTTLECANALKENGIVSSPVLDGDTRAEILDSLDSCGNGIENMDLSLETVKLLKSKGEAFYSKIKIVWNSAARKYSEGTTGYLSMIAGLSPDPQKARGLADSINKAADGDPSVKAIEGLVANVKEAKKITDAFALNPEIETFLKKVSSQQATVLDLTPSILAWLKEKNLTNKLKLRF
jgi:hypothetical protein